MTEQEFLVVGTHAVALEIAAELLAEASNKATQEDWLTLILAKAHTRYQEMNPEELKAALDRTIEALGGSSSDVEITVTEVEE